MYGYDLEQIVNEGGGIRQLNGCANGLKAEAMLAFLDGMILAARALKARVAEDALAERDAMRSRA